MWFCHFTVRSGAGQLRPELTLPFSHLPIIFPWFISCVNFLDTQHASFSRLLSINEQVINKGTVLQGICDISPTLKTCIPATDQHRMKVTIVFFMWLKPLTVHIHIFFYTTFKKCLHLIFYICVCVCVCASLLKYKLCKGRGLCSEHC